MVEEKNIRKLNSRDVRAIRLLYARKIYNGREIADLFGVSKELIYRILRGELWQSVK